MRKTIGDFKVYATDPYPIQVIIEDKAGAKIRFNHKDLADIKHALSEAEKHCKCKLGDEAKEV